MDLTDIPRKTTALANVDVANVRTRRIFILADGKRDLGEIFKQGNIPNAEGFQLTQILLEKGYLDLFDAANARQRAPALDTDRAVPTTWLLDILEHEYAKYVGPAATVILGDLRLDTESLSSEQRRVIIADLLRRLDHEADREQFLAAIGRQLRIFDAIGVPDDAAPDAQALEYEAEGEDEYVWPDAPEAGELMSRGAFMDVLEREYAKFVGPAAAILIDDLELDDASLSLEQRRHAVRRLVREIDDDSEKQRFLESMSAAGVL